MLGLLAPGVEVQDVDVAKALMRGMMSGRLEEHEPEEDLEQEGAPQPAPGQADT